jgi:hypothetical protein
MDTPRVPTNIEGDEVVILIKVANFVNHFAPAMVIYRGDPHPVAGFNKAVPIFDECVHGAYNVAFIF